MLFIIKYINDFQTILLFILVILFQRTLLEKGHLDEFERFNIYWD